MHVILIVVGAMLGLVVGTQFGAEVALFGMILGGFVGYTLIELASLRVRNRDLQREIDLLKERLNALWRREKESGAGSPGASGAPTEGGAPGD